MRRRCLFKSQKPPSDYYLEVDKPEIQWVNINLVVEYNIYSNTNWFVE